MLYNLSGLPFQNLLRSSSSDSSKRLFPKWDMYSGVRELSLGILQLTNMKTFWYTLQIHLCFELFSISKWCSALPIPCLSQVQVLDTCKQAFSNIQNIWSTLLFTELRTLVCCIATCLVAFISVLMEEQITLLCNLVCTPVLWSTKQ